MGVSNPAVIKLREQKRTQGRLRKSVESGGILPLLWKKEDAEGFLSGYEETKNRRAD